MEEDIKILEDIEILESECYYLEELGYLKENNHFIRFNQALKNLIKGYKEKEESEKYLYDAYQDAGKKMFEYAEQLEDSIPKSKIKEFFTSRLEKYQEADDGAYEQDYLTRGELELVDRYKECKEIAKILLEEEIEAEIPQDCIPKSKIRENIEELNNYDSEFSQRVLNHSEHTLTEFVQNILQELL